MKWTCITGLVFAAYMLAACTQQNHQNEENMGVIPKNITEQVITKLSAKHGSPDQERIEKGVLQTAALWKQSDGTNEAFETFCLNHFKPSGEARRQLFDQLSFNYEKVWGHFNQMNLELNKALHLDDGPVDETDIMFASYAPSAHLTEDFFDNKIAFLTVLNFPFYTLEEKAEWAEQWSRLDWAYARMGDVYTSRVPASVNQESSRVTTETESYISEYNIIMDRLVDQNGNELFSEPMRLITHWGLRDEIKSNYADPKGLEKQRIIYKVMEHIIHQTIPRVVINNPELSWEPYTNTVYQDGVPMEAEAEPDTRYTFLLDNFHASRAADAYSPDYPTAIQRAFDQGLELTQQEVEALFIELVSSPVLKDVGQLISQRLGRKLEPFDIWYDGFKARNEFSEEELNDIVLNRYPDEAAFDKDLPNILVNLGWEEDRAQTIASKIVVEASRGSGHAWGAVMRSQNSHLRTRVGANGMDYKGYNIAIHEFGHNVEQTISLHDVDHYILSGVPNTAFTEALAFIFQTRDLDLLGIPEQNPDASYLNVLDKIWGSYEIMGVSLVDMYVWLWMYDNPDATAAELKEKTIEIAKEVWNAYFAPVIGVKDAPILAVYSHMINYPLYLSAYPIGRLIEFQLEKALTGNNLARETDKVFALGKLIPQEWMKQAVGSQISSQPMIDAAVEAVTKLNSQ